MLLSTHNFSFLLRRDNKISINYYPICILFVHLLRFIISEREFQVIVIIITRGIQKVSIKGLELLKIIKANIGM